MSTLSTRFRITRLRNGNKQVVDDALATEEPLEIRLAYRDPMKGRSHKSVAITMRTPGDDHALALGFLFSESVISDLSCVSEITEEGENVVKVTLKDSTVFDPLRIERNFYVTSSCGLCGKSSLDSLSNAGFSALPETGFGVSLQHLQHALQQLKEQQPLFRMTGGNHATALLDAQGKILRVTEDVGRHNAMDKLIGHCLQEQRIPLSNHAILVSGRASFELMQKALAAGCPFVAAVGAPSSLAVELAEEYNLTLVGFLGETGCNIYHGASRLPA